MMLGCALCNYNHLPGMANLKVSSLHFVTLELLISDSNSLTSFYAQWLSKSSTLIVLSYQRTSFQFSSFRIRIRRNPNKIFGAKTIVFQLVFVPVLLNELFYILLLQSLLWISNRSYESLNGFRSKITDSSINTPYPYTFPYHVILVAKFTLISNTYVIT